MTKFVAGPIEPEQEPTIITVQQIKETVQVVAANSQHKQVIAEVICGKLFIPEMNEATAVALGLEFDNDCHILLTFDNGIR